MNRKWIKTIQIITVILCLILGTCLHFLYQWSGNNGIVATFCSVNESIWEHLKLAFFPMLLMTILGAPFLVKKSNNYIEAKMIGIFTAISFIVVAFYTYSGILGTNILWVDILLFVLSIILGEYVAYKIMIRDSESTFFSQLLSVIILLLLTVSFIVFTYYPPKANLFRDTEGDFYGIPTTIK